MLSLDLAAVGCLIDAIMGAMSSRIAVLAIDAADPEAIAEFWCQVLGWVITERWDSGVSIGPDGGGDGPTMDVIRVPEPKTLKNRLHLDLRADGVSTSEELQRLLDLGAQPTDVGQSADATWVVLADPEGNEFCLLSRSVEDVDAEKVIALEA